MLSRVGPISTSRGGRLTSESLPSQGNGSSADPELLDGGSSPIPSIALAGASTSMIAAASMAVMLCMRRDAAATHASTVRSLLLPIAIADTLAAAFWIRAEVRIITSPDRVDAPWMCSLCASLGNLAFAWMSAFTCLLAGYLRAALTMRRGTQRPPRLLLQTAWLLPMLLVGGLEVGHHERCVENAKADASRSKWLPPWYAALARGLWTFEFIALPIATMAFSAFCYWSVHRHFRLKGMIADETLSETLRSASSSMPPSTSCSSGACDDDYNRGSARLSEEPMLHDWRGVALRLDLRLLSYLLAYAACQLPALPSSILDGSEIYAPHYGVVNANDAAEGCRVLIQPLQGLLNAVVFAHHARQRHDRA